MNSKTIIKILLTLFGIATLIVLTYLQIITKSIANLTAIGIDTATIYLLFILPVITLFISFARIILGINVGNFFMSIVLILASYVIGLIPVLLFLIISYILGLAFRTLIYDFHIHFVSKLSLIISAISICLLVLLQFLLNPIVIGTPVDLNLLIIYVVLIFSLLIDKYLNFKITRVKLRDDLVQLSNTVLFTIVTYLILGGVLFFGESRIQFTAVQDFLLNNPESILFVLAFNVLIGLYTGLRLSEVFKFRKLIFKK